MNCQEAIVSDDYVDFIWKIDVRYTGTEGFPFGVCTQYVNRDFSIFYVSRDEAIRDEQMIPIGDYAIPYCYTQMDTESLEYTRILPIQNQPALKLRGSGVLIGILDSGIALDNPAFRTMDERISLWQRLFGGRDQPASGGRADGPSGIRPHRSRHKGRVDRRRFPDRKREFHRSRAGIQYCVCEIKTGKTIHPTAA